MGTLCTALLGARAAGVRAAQPVRGVLPGRGLHSLTLELNLSNSGTHSLLKLGYTVDRIAEVELK
jgi:hypothetical protein